MWFILSIRQGKGAGRKGRGGTPLVLSFLFTEHDDAAVFQIARRSLPCPAGPDGRLTVKLSQAINVEAISIEHAPRELLLNKGVSAPKDFTVMGECKG